jgi:hypothetical protein
MTHDPMEEMPMRPVHVSVEVAEHPDAVFDFLDVLANHERFTDHFLRDWQCDGPVGGVGAKARVTAVTGGRSDVLEMEVVRSERPRLSVERNVSLGGRRVVTGTYTLTGRPGGGTTVEFVSAWERLPWSERLAAPIVRRLVRRANEQAMRRLAEQLAERAPR